MAGSTTSDRLLGGRVVLQQPKTGFRAAIDAVLLAAAVDAPTSAMVLDVGCGSGAATLCLAWRRPDLRLTGLELDPAMAALAAANAALSPAAARIAVVEGDLLAPPPSLKGRSFAAVMTNPPFNAAAGRAVALAGRGLAMTDAVGPAAWLAACLKRLEPRGRLVLIHRADRLPELLAALDGPAGEVEIIPLWPDAEAAAAKRVILRCRKGVRGPARLRQGLVLHDRTGKFTGAAEAVLRHGAALDDVLSAG